MMNVPDLSNLAIVTRRYIEAAILKKFLMEFKKRFDSEAAEQIIGSSCSNSAIAHGADMAQ